MSTPWQKPNVAAKTPAPGSPPADAYGKQVSRCPAGDSKTEVPSNDFFVCF